MSLPTLLAVAAAAGAGYWLYQKNKTTAVPNQMPGAPTGIVSKLEKGKSYAIMATITSAVTDDPGFKALPGTDNNSKIAQMLTAVFQQCGFQITGNVAIRDTEEMKKALAGQPSTWVLTGKWMLDQDHITATPPAWVGNAAFVLLPTQ
jgi:hypothetical protein